MTKTRGLRSDHHVLLTQKDYSIVHHGVACPRASIPTFLTFLSVKWADGKTGPEDAAPGTRTQELVYRLGGSETYRRLLILLG
jgi:hypothetical protein|uniref:Uncharacterized protein n=1 Tax=Picea glauca TaxID=3330 RepID=A0A124GNQ3_PICGL|nr:hypothetical protein ABT39_MTgene2788 [Picea glauca]QHR89647.1 hypothetical protein Q903MT_gene3669 [Picea sitchensis]